MVGLSNGFGVGVALGLSVGSMVGLSDGFGVGAALGFAGGKISTE